MQRLASFILVCWIGVSAAAGTQREDIPPQPLIQALNTFAAQTGLQLMYVSDLAEGRVSNGSPAGLPPAETLARLLEGTSLTFEFLNERTVAIRAQKGKGIATSDASPGEVRSAELRLVRADEPAAAVQNTALSAQETARGSGRNSTGEADTSAKGVPEILVKGARTLNMDIKRSVDDPQPYVVFDRKKIEHSGAINVQDFLKNNLTMNTTMGSPSQSTGGFTGDSSSINLRGLGTGQTLVLVDGRRIANVMLSSTPQQPDLNGIPLSAIERIEVLPSTASGIYGGGATGGVVNVVLRRDYQGAEAKVIYENSFDSDSSMRQFDLSTGFSLEEGRTNVLLAGTYSDKNPLKLRDRDLAQRAYFRVLANNPAYINSNATSMPRGYTSNIRSANGSNLVLKQNNTPLNASFTFVPVGYAGPRTDNGMALIANAGRYNTDYSTTPQFGFLLPGGELPFYNSPTVESLTATVRRSFTPKVDAFLEVFGSNNVAETFKNTSLQSPITLAVTAPNNPFTTPIQVQIADGSANGITTSRINTRRAGGGVIVKLPKSWLSEADFTWSRASLFWMSPAGTFMPDAITNQLTSGAVDIMRDMNIYGGLSPSVWPEYAQRTTTPYVSTTRNSTLRFSGPAGQLPAGAIALSAALEYRDDQLASGINNVLQTNGTFNNNFTPDRSQSVASGYVEARAPVLRDLEVQLAVRYDSYTTEGATGSVNLTADPTGASIIRVKSKLNSTNPTVALRYQWVKDLALRASYGTGFLPPAVNQLAPNASTTTTSTYSDPRRGGNGPTGSYAYYSGGNAQLKPEESQNWSAGVVFTPRFLPALRLSVDYSQFDKTDNIITPTLQQIIDNEAVLPGRVTRGANLSTDPAGWAGPITSVDASLVNVSKAKIKVYDAQLDYQLEFASLGSLALNATGTWQTSYQTQVVPTTPVVENVGYRGQPLRFKADAGITWTLAQWSAGWNSHYFDSYRVYAPTDTVATVTQVAAAQGHGGRVSAQIYHDVFAAYRFERPAGRVFGLLSDTQIQAGIRNVFDSKPPVDILSGNAGYSLYGDPRLMTYYLSLKKAF